MDRRIAKTKNAIVQAYLELTKEKEGRRITVTEIAKVADIDRKTFYLHYSQVEDILMEMIDNKLAILESLLQENGFYNEESNAFLITKSLNDLFLQDLDLFKRMAKDCIFNPFWSRVEDLVYEALLSKVEADKAAEDFKWVYARFYAAGNLAVYKAWLLDNHGIELERMNTQSGLKAYLKASSLFNHDETYEQQIISMIQ